MLRKIFSLFTLFFLLSTGVVSAQQNFYSDLNATYDFKSDGNCEVEYKILLENALGDFYAQSYVLNLQNINAKKINATYNNDEIPVFKSIENENYFLRIDFEDYVIGERKAREFTINFETEDFAKRTGEVWEINIPRISELHDFRKYDAQVSTPISFGELSFISPKPDSIVEEENENVYEFNSSLIKDRGISFGFGEYQLFTFRIVYHLENENSYSEIKEIAIPPDTSYQKIYYENINPKPSEINVDTDGNWIAKYLLKQNERLDVEINGLVKIFSSSIKHAQSTNFPLSYYIKPTNYWQSDDEQIILIANTLKTPKKIFQYVSSQLSYDYQRVSKDIRRLGAVDALNNPDSALCMEFTDLFIALSRAAGIPAREINGYAYTNNPQIQPLSLVADVLHSWPEYWDDDKNEWIPVDPTWSSTTQGVDYFSKLDLRHFAFVIHGIDDETPYPPGSYKLGDNPQKDVFISFGNAPKNDKEDFQINPLNKGYLNIFRNKYDVNLKNLGESAIYDIQSIVTFDGNIAEESNIRVLPPFSEVTLTIDVPFTLLGLKSPNEVKIYAYDKELTIVTYKGQKTVIYLLIFSVSLTLVTLLTIKKFGKLRTKK